MNWKFDTFVTDGPGMGTVRILGFGVIVYAVDSPWFDAIDKMVWGVDIWPGWRFAFVAPWM
jgi:hypothetical protein